MAATAGPNEEQVAYWNEVAGPKWVALCDVLDAQLAPLGADAIDRAAPREGERVVDVGCGCGSTSLELARRVGPRGSVLGVDVSGPMLEEARRRADEAGLAQLDFERGDAQVLALPEAGADLVFSRFGVMFFADPVAAFANLRRALADGGRLAFLCWQPIGENPWMLVPALAAAEHVELPAPAGPDAPGPFAFGDPERVRRILGDAGFRGAACEDYRGRVTVGAGLPLDRIIDFLQQMGPAGRALQDAPAETRAAAAAAMREAVAPYDTGDGLAMDFAAWIVSARA